MIYKNMIVVIYDWSGNLNFSFMMAGIESIMNEYFVSLSNCGMYKAEGRKRVFYEKIDFLNKDVKSEVEIYGSLKRRKDIDAWESYFLYKKSNHGSTMILEASLNILKIESIVELMKRFSSISNIGYGYAKKSVGGAGGVFEALGVTFGFPKSPIEKKKADEDSRWFDERLLVNGSQKMRHLKGMFRSVYEVNIINDFHLSIDIDGRSLRSVVTEDEDFGELIGLNNGSYIWVIPEDQVARIRKCVNLAGGVI